MRGSGDPIAHAALRIFGRHYIGDDGDRVGAGSECERSPVQADAAYGDEPAIDLRAPSASRSKPCGAQGRACELSCRPHPKCPIVGIRLGVSTHSDTELKAALAANPDYVALGPIYATTLKALPWAPQGLLRLAEWRAKIDCRLVAIGGISLDRAPLALAAGANSVAVITDIMTAEDPERRVGNWIAATAQWRNLSTGTAQA